MAIKAGKFYPHLKLKGFVLTLSMEMLEDFIFILLLDRHTGGLNWKISSLLSKLKDFIFVSPINVPEGLILIILLKVTSEEKEMVRPNSHIIDAWLLQK